MQNTVNNSVEPADIVTSLVGLAISAAALGGMYLISKHAGKVSQDPNTSEMQKFKEWLFRPSR